MSCNVPIRSSTACLTMTARATAVPSVSPGNDFILVFSAATTSPLRSRNGTVTSTAPLSFK